MPCKYSKCGKHPNTFRSQKLIYGTLLLTTIRIAAAYLTGVYLTERLTLTECIRRLIAVSTTTANAINNGLCASHQFLAIFLPVLKEHLSTYATKIKHSMTNSKPTPIASSSYSAFYAKFD